MPGVADQVRRTQLKQAQKRRKRDMEELIQMVREDRLHEADERQLETLRLIAELQKALPAGVPDVSVNVDDKKIIKAIKKAMHEVVAEMPATGAVLPAAGPARPEMKHTSLSDLGQDDHEVEISHSDDLGEEQTGAEDSAAKLEKLRKIKGG